MKGKATDGHIKAGSSECAGVGIDQLSGDAKVAKFDDAFAGEQHVGWLDVTMNGLLCVEVS